MTRLAQSVGCCVFVLLVTALCPAEEAKLALPEPDYRPLASDPAWLAQTVQFHGHLGPTVVAGARLAEAPTQSGGDIGRPIQGGRSSPGSDRPQDRHPTRRKAPLRPDGLPVRRLSSLRFRSFAFS